MFDLRLQNYEENVPKCDTSEKNVKKNDDDASKASSSEVFSCYL